MAHECIHICLVVLSGLPGSGKTTLCVKLKQYLVQNSDMACSCIHVCYDQLLPQDIERKLLLDGMQEEASGWKIYRNKILHCVQKVVLSLREATGHRQHGACAEAVEVSDNSASHMNTFGSLQQSQNIVKPEDVDDFLWHRFHEYVIQQLFEVNLFSVKTVIILIDDNMFYRSMRHAYYQLAREYRLAFCQISMCCSPERAIQNNQLREVQRQVPQSVIKEMQGKLEVPDPQKYSWEINNMKISSLVLKTMQEIEELIKSALSSPVMPVISDEAKEEQEESRRICLQNLVHQVDQMLRKLIGQQMKQISAQENISKTSKKTYGENLNSIRTEILECVKHEKLQLPDSEKSHELIMDGSSTLYQNLEEVFMNKARDIKPGT